MQYTTCLGPSNAPDQKRAGADRTDSRFRLPPSGSGCWASPLDKKSVQSSHEDHAVFTHPVIVQNDGHVVDHAIGVNH